MADADSPIIEDTIPTNNIEGSKIEFAASMAGETIPTTNVGGSIIKDATPVALRINL